MCLPEEEDLAAFSLDAIAGIVKETPEGKCRLLGGDEIQVFRGDFDLGDGTCWGVWGASRNHHRGGS